MLEVLETCIYAQDLEAIRSFYENIVGLECFLFKPPSLAFFKAGRGVFLVFNPDASENLEKLPPHGARGSVHVCFKVKEDNVPAWKVKFEKLGYETYNATWKDGKKSFYVYDPAGNLVEFAPPTIWGLKDD